MLNWVRVGDPDIAIQCVGDLWTDFNANPHYIRVNFNQRNSNIKRMFERKVNIVLKNRPFFRHMHHYFSNST